MHPDIYTYNQSKSSPEKDICQLLAERIDTSLTEAESKIWHAHPVWFIDGNPIVGYSQLKAGIRLMFWSGASFSEPSPPDKGKKFKDASITYSLTQDIVWEDFDHWIEQSKIIQWDYKNIVKRKGKLERLK